MPTIEYLLSGLYSIFGISYRTAEVFSAIIMIFSTLLLFDIARRTLGKQIGLFVIAIFSCSSLLFRYHIFEREIFTLAISILVLWFIVSRKLEILNAIIIGIIAGFGFTIKFSGLFVVPAIIVYLLIERKYREALFAILSFVITSSVIYGLFFLKYGESVYEQVFLFHFFKGYDFSAGVRFFDTFIRDLNYLWVLGFSGIFLSVLYPGRILVFAFVIFVVYAVFFLFISSTCWPHNMIDLLLPLSLGSGVSLCFIHRFISEPKKNALPFIFIIICLAVFILFGSLNPRYYQGFGYIPRKEVAEVAKFIRGHTSAGMPVHASHYIASEAQRLKFIDYEELIGPQRLMIAIRRNQISGVDRLMKTNDWYGLIEKTLPLWRNELNQAFVDKRISCAVWDKKFPEWSLMYNIDRYLENKMNFFSNAGYQIMYNTDYYTIWLVHR